MAERSFTFVEDTEYDNLYCWLSGAVRFGEIDVKTVRALVDSVLNGLNDGDCISSITIIGHGSAGNISVGNGRSGTDKSKEIGLGNENDWGPQLDRLACKFCKKGTVYLRGCNVGAGSSGAGLLHQIKKRLKCARVLAPTGVCDPVTTGGEDQESGPEDEDPPEPLPNPDKEKAKKKGTEVGLSGGTGVGDLVLFEAAEIKAARMLPRVLGHEFGPEFVPALGAEVPGQLLEALRNGLAGSVPASYPMCGFSVDALLQLEIEQGGETILLPPAALVGEWTYYSALHSDTPIVYILPAALSADLQRFAASSTDTGRLR